MDKTVAGSEIVKYVRMLMPSLYKKPISEAKISKLNYLYRTNQTLCIREIIEECGLRKLDTYICYIRNTPSRTAILGFIQEKMASIGCSVADFLLPEGTEKASAFVVYSKNLPLFGTPDFESEKIVIFVFNQRICESFEAFVHCIAHELCHVILDAIKHPLRKEEIAVDLAAMILGFCNVIQDGRHSSDAIHGYLDDFQFEIAYEEIRKLSGVIYL